MRCELLHELPGGGRVLFTMRADGNMSSVGGDGREQAEHARERLRERIGVARLARGYQEHGTVVQRVTVMPAPERPGEQRPRADGQATPLAGVGALVLAADCLPVALGCDGGVAILHAGWRGLAAGVLDEGVRALRELAGAQPIHAIVGPGAGACCYEVGPEVHRAFADGHRHGRNIDLHAIARERLLAAGVAEVQDVGACTICDERFFSHRREGARAGLQAQTIRANLERVRAEIAAAGERTRARQPGGEPREVEVLAAIKYIATEDLPLLADAGVRLVGENRAQELQEKVAAHGELFEWDFIGQLQSRRVRLIVPHVRLIHSLASESALRELERHLALARPGLRILLEVNVAGEPGKAGIAPEEIDAYIARSPVPVAGLMTMPPLSPEPEDSRRWFAALRELAREHRLEHLSMGTSQDYVVAVEEGATIVRIGTSLYH